MTRRPQDIRPVRRSGGDPYGVGRAAPFLAPLLSMAGLLVIAVVTLFALTGRVPFLGSPTASGVAGLDPEIARLDVHEGTLDLDRRVDVRQRRSPTHELGPRFAADVVAG